ncbi:MAG: GntR family transcriptional regulator [Nocardioides sp.]|uniref:GntR family transcriptional regulator n=1 Tax=Nocardioides sp. TaxID=35761 RepID=UPI0039E2BBDD
MASATEVLADPEDRSEEIVRLLRLEERREPVVALVATWVGLGIVEGRLKPGQDLNSVELSQRLGSSRTPVREALMLLESEGLVEIRARRRPRVAAFTPERVRDIYFVRKRLLVLIGQLVAEHVTDEQVAELREMLALMQASVDGDDVDGYFWGHVNLQRHYVEIAGNQILGEMLDTLALRTLVLRRAALAREGRLSASIADQYRILEAIEHRDGELAALLFSRATDAALAAIDLSELSS